MKHILSHVLCPLIFIYSVPLVQANDDLPAGGVVPPGHALQRAQNRQPEIDKTLTKTLQELSANVFDPESEQAKELKQAVYKNLRARRDAVNRRETFAWRKVKSRADWEKYRNPRIKALKDSLGTFPPPAQNLKVRVTGGFRGDGFAVENLLFESRPGLVVSANLYRPRIPPAKLMPGILICHSHHNPKTQGELQDMGMTWARIGCTVLVMDQLGHGERRQHPFTDKTKYKGSFRVSRQDYYFRYNTGIQLHLIGDSLMGWMVWDLMRGVDLLWSRPDVDKKRIIMLGAVAGGGDPVGVTAALDPRIAAVVPFNFGGPEPENRFPLPKDAELTFNYAGSGSWESTRNLRLSCRDGFLPWVIVGSVAPRALSYAHEFAWDKERDPVWKRFQTIYGFYKAGDRLSSVKGRGSVRGRPPESTHCNNIGSVHRKQIHPAFKRWFGIAIPKEYRNRLPAEKLLCVNKSTKITPLYKLAGRIGAERAAVARKQLQQLPQKQQAQLLRKKWDRLLGSSTPLRTRKVMYHRGEKQRFVAERFALVDTLTAKQLAAGMIPEPAIPVLLLAPGKTKTKKTPVVVALAHGGKAAFLKHRANAIAKLLEKGVAVCLPDVRGTGEGSPGDSRGRRSSGTSISSNALMMGDTMVGARLRDLRSVLQSLRRNPRIDAKRIALWGDSFAPVNSPDRNFSVPLDADLPKQSEPLGGLLALLGGLYEPDVRAVCVRGGLVGFDSVLHSQFCYFPHDVVVPGALTAGDLCDVAAALAPRPLRIEGLVDGLNRRVSKATLFQTYNPARTAYGPSGNLALQVESSSAGEMAAWLEKQIR